MGEALEACENCGRSIGRLESAHVHEGHVVCGECLDRLVPQAVPYAVPVAAAQPIGEDRPVTVQLTAKRWKRVQLIGGCIIVASFLFIPIVNFYGSWWIMPQLVVLAIGSLVVFVGGIMAWWHHG
jgi:hypothetical protein